MRRAILAFLVLVSTAPAALADDSRLIQTAARGSAIVAGPALVDGSVVWAAREPRARGVAFIEYPDGFRTTVGSVRGGGVLLVAAARGRLALGSYWVGCPPRDELCGRDFEMPRRGRLVAGSLVGSGLQPVEPGCTAYAADITADAVAWSCLGASGVLDAGGGVTRYAGHPLRIAGSYAAVRNGAVLRTYDRRTGQRVLERADVRDHDIDHSGRVAILDTSDRIWLLQPGQPERLIGVQQYAKTVLLGGERIAVWDGSAFTIRDTSGGVVASHRLDGKILGWDFDGERIAWLQKPCSAASIAVWRLDQSPPASTGQGCSHPRVERGAVVLTRGGQGSFGLACPAAARAGCAGSVTVALRGRSPRVESLMTRRYDLDGGQRDRIALRASRSDAARLRRARTRFAELTVGSTTTRRRLAVRRAAVEAGRSREIHPDTVVLAGPRVVWAQTSYARSERGRESIVASLRGRVRVLRRLPYRSHRGAELFLWDVAGSSEMVVYERGNMFFDEEDASDRREIVALRGRRPTPVHRCARRDRFPTYAGVSVSGRRAAFAGDVCTGRRRVIVQERTPDGRWRRSDFRVGGDVDALDLNRRHLAVLSSDNRIRVFDVVRRRPVARYQFSDHTNRIAALVDGGVAIGDYQPRIFRPGARRGRRIGPSGYGALHAAGRLIVRDRRPVIGDGDGPVRVDVLERGGQRRQHRRFPSFGELDGVQDADAYCIVWTRRFPYGCLRSACRGAAVVAAPVRGRVASPACGG